MRFFLLIGGVVFFFGGMVTWFLLRGRKDKSFFDRNLLKNFKDHSSFQDLKNNAFELIGINPIEEISRTLLNYVDETQKIIGTYERPNIPRYVAAFKLEGKVLKINYPLKLEVLTKLSDESTGADIATISATSFASASATVKFSDAEVMTVSPPKNKTFTIFKSAESYWHNSQGELVGVSVNLMAPRRSNVYLLAISKSALPHQRLAMLAFFTA